MEILFEFILELLIEGGIEISSNKKVNKFVRYFILSLIILFFSFVIFGILFLGMVILKQSAIGGIFVIVIGLMMLILSIIKFKKIYFNKNNNKDKNI